MEHTKQLGEARILRLLIKYSLPAIIGMLVNGLYNIVDRIFIGNGVGDIGITGITLGFPIMILQMAFGMLIGIGATSLISIRLGQNNKNEAERIMGNAFMLLITLAVINSALGLAFLEPLLKLFNASETAMPYAKDYLEVILYGNVFMAIGFGMNNCIRAQGSPKTAMLTMLIGAAVNIALDPLFIFVFGWGMKGAALATVISQGISALWVLYYFLGGKSLLKLHVKNLKIDKKIVLAIVSIGIAPFAMQIAASLLNIILNSSLQQYGGDVAVAAMGISTSIVTLIMMPIIGISQGAQPIIGYNYGAERYDRVKKTFIIAAVSGTIVATLGFIAVMLWPAEIIRLFNKDKQELITLGTNSMRVFLFLLPAIGIQIIGSQYFQAVGKPKKAMVLTLSRQVLFLIPLILILPKFYGFDGILYAGPISDSLSAIVTGIWIYNELNHLQNRHEEVTNRSQVEEINVDYNVI